MHVIFFVHFVRNFYISFVLINFVSFMGVAIYTPVPHSLVITHHNILKPFLYISIVIFFSLYPTFMRKLNNGLMVVADRVSQAWKVKQLDHQKAGAVWLFD